MSLIDEDDESNFVIPLWDFEHSLILHLLDVLNERVSICVYEVIVNSLLEISAKKIVFTSRHRGLYIPSSRFFVSPLVSNLLAHHKENGMGYVAIGVKYGFSVRNVMRKIRSIKKVNHEN